MFHLKKEPVKRPVCAYACIYVFIMYSFNCLIKEKQNSVILINRGSRANVYSLQQRNERVYNTEGLLRLVTHFFPCLHCSVGSVAQYQLRVRRKQQACKCSA